MAIEAMCILPLRFFTSLLFSSPLSSPIQHSLLSVARALAGPFSRFLCFSMYRLKKETMEKSAKREEFGKGEESHGRESKQHWDPSLLLTLADLVCEFPLFHRHLSLVDEGRGEGGEGHQNMNQADTCCRSSDRRSSPPFSTPLSLYLEELIRLLLNIVLASFILTQTDAGIGEWSLYSMTRAEIYTFLLHQQQEEEKKTPAVKLSAKLLADIRNRLLRYDLCRTPYVIDSWSVLLFHHSIDYDAYYIHFIQTYMHAFVYVHTRQLSTNQSAW